MSYTDYRNITGNILNIQTGSTCCITIITVRSGEETVNFVVTGDTEVIGSVRLRRGMRVAAFYDTTLPVPAIYPPQYHAELIAPLRPNQEAALNFFDQTLTAEDNSLKLNIGPMTRIETQNGQQFRCDPRNMDLLVYYTTTTFSIPPQTTPQKIVVMCPEK